MKKNIFHLLIFLFLLSACGRGHKQESAQQNYVSGEKAFIVLEVIQTSKYTYFKVSENYGVHWVAVSKINASEGDKFYYEKVLPMKNFWSKELERNFEAIDFISQISKTPIVNSEPKMNPHTHSGKVPEIKESQINFKKSKKELSIAQIYAHPADYNNREVIIKGKVTKVNKNIMGKNWIHIQDGTEYDNNFDLTITSKFLPSVNQLVSFRGIIYLNKDFGAGYYYPVIMENANAE